jgi:hypothetical protein
MEQYKILNSFFTVLQAGLIPFIIRLRTVSVNKTGVLEQTPEADQMTECRKRAARRLLSLFFIILIST